MLLQTRQHACGGQQFKTLGQCGGISCVLKLTQHPGIRQDLPGESTAQFEQPAQQSRLIDTAQQQDVAGNRGFDQCIQQVAPPSLGLTGQRAAPG